jgi:hypothetical protein
MPCALASIVCGYQLIDYHPVQMFYNERYVSICVAKQDGAVLTMIQRVWAAGCDDEDLVEAGLIKWPVSRWLLHH